VFNLLYRGIPHLPRPWPVDEDAVSSEEASISTRDFFGVTVGADDDFDDSEQNPFVVYLRDALAAVSNSDVAETLSWSPYGPPSYEICAE
jgi:hypothetical protein